MNSQKNKTVYFDYAATTPVEPTVLEAMLPFFCEAFGNTSSIHRIGQQAETALENARLSMTEVLGCREDELIITSCGSESDNLALRGVAYASRRRGNHDHILISPVEHHAILKTAQQLAAVHGFEVEYLPVDEFGLVGPDEVQKRLRKNTALVSIIYGNNEIGTVNPIAEIGQICRQNNVPFHTDAVQAAAYLPVAPDQLNVDLISLGAHKFYGPKGVGALYVRKTTPILPVLTGGSQEYGLRAGTHNVPYIVGMAKAFQLAQSEHRQRAEAIKPLRDRLIGRVLEEIPETRLTGHPVQRLPNHASFVFNNVDGNALLMLLDEAGFACSSGSACKTGDPEPSGVLLALGLSRNWALGSLRVTLGKSSTAEQVEAFCDVLPDLVQRVRALN